MLPKGKKTFIFALSAPLRPLRYIEKQANADEVLSTAMLDLQLQAGINIPGKKVIVSGVADGLNRDETFPRTGL